jgi:hypothetical protein
LESKKPGIRLKSEANSRSRAKTGIEPGSTPLDSPVARLATGGQVVSKSSLSNPEPPSCGMGGCGTGMCSLQ